MILSCYTSILDCVPATAEDEIEPWPSMGVPGPMAMSRQDVVVWASFLCDEIEAFTFTFCRHYKHLSSLQWNCILLHGRQGFQIYAAIGCMRMLQEHGASVSAWLLQSDAPMLEYYAGLCQPFRIPVHVLEDAGHRQAANVLPVGSMPLFQDNHGRWVQPEFAKPYWQEWEKEQPHCSIRADVSGFPFYCNPGISLLLMDIIDHWRPMVVLDAFAWKLGTTALLARLTSYLGSKVVAINPHGLPDEAHYASLVVKPWVQSHGMQPYERIDLVRWDGHEELTGLPALNPGSNVMAFINVHQRAILERLTRSVREKYAMGVLVFHAAQHADMPDFLNDLKNDKTLKPIIPGCTPPGGAWCDNGIFQFGA